MNPKYAGSSKIEKHSQNKNYQHQSEDPSKRKKPRKDQEHRQQLGNRQTITDVHGSKEISGLLIKFVITFGTAFVHFRSFQLKQ